MKPPNEELVKKHQELLSLVKEAEEVEKKAKINKIQKSKQLAAFEKQYGDMQAKVKGYERHQEFLNTRVPLENQPEGFQTWFKQLVEKNLNDPMVIAFERKKKGEIKCLV